MLDVHNTYIDAEQVTYEEVASVISNKDDPNMLCLTFRVWILGLFFAGLQAFINQYQWYRTLNQYSVSPALIILLSFVFGKFFAWILPKKSWCVGHNYKFSFNPGPFTLKEHVLIFLTSTASSHDINFATPFDFQKLWYKKSVNGIAVICFCASLYFMVFGIAGIMRRFLVWPSALLWPENLPTIILIRTLNDQLVDNSSLIVSNIGRKLGRLHFFIITVICHGVYYWLPNYVMKILRAFAWLCWFKPNNLILAQLTGTDGFGIGSLMFNWTSIKNFWGSPIIVPSWAKVNILIGFILIVWILSPLCFYTNFLQLHYSPIRTTQILRSKRCIEDFNYYIDYPTLTFNETKYKLYVETCGEIRWSVALILQFGLVFALITSLIVHTLLYHGQDILKYARTSVSNRNNDIHCFLMSQYPETPEWWFITVFMSSLSIAIVVCRYSQLIEWFNVLLSVVVGWMFILPYGIIRANTAFTLIGDFPAYCIGSLIAWNKPLEVTTFIHFVLCLQTDGLGLISNLKLCHYTKIPPRSAFIMLFAGRLIATIVGYVVRYYLFTIVPNICYYTHPTWSCPGTQSDVDQAITWATTGPRIWFSGIYKPLLWLLLIGAILPVPCWILHRKYPNITWLKHIHIPIMLMPGVYWYTASSANTLTWLLFCLLCHLCIHRWWYKHYSLLFSIGMDVGAAISGTIYFFTFYSRNIQFPDWWGARYDDKCPLASRA